MPREYCLQLSGNVPLRTLDGVPNSVWTYTVTWTDRPPLTSIDPNSRLALIFSSRINISDPKDLPDVSDIQNTYIERPGTSDVQFVWRNLGDGLHNTLDFCFVAPSELDMYTPVKLALQSKQVGQWADVQSKVSPQGLPAFQQVISGPAVVCSATTPADFSGTLPYASEVFGVYQPLAGWLGQRTTQLLGRSDTFMSLPGPVERIFSGDQAPMASTELVIAVAAQVGEMFQAVLSPVGLVTLFREYFFEFDNFLGAPSGHLWISPGGTVEVVESSTRRTLIERTAEQSEDSTSKVEESLTNQDDLADAVKEDNANDTKLGASASAGAKFAGIYQADASASFSSQATIRKSSEVTHKHTRTQSARVSSEIHRNFKTTFKTVTESTDVSSRRYVVQNTTNKLVNYELRRKMRKVGVQVQHIGTRLSWQVFLDMPGTELGLGELVHVVPAPDLSLLKKPEQPPPLQAKDAEFSAVFPLRKFPGTANDPHQDANYTRSEEHPGGITGMHSDNNDDHIVGDFEYNAPPPAPEYTIKSIRLVSAKTQSGDARVYSSNLRLSCRVQG